MHISGSKSISLHQKVPASGRGFASAAESEAKHRALLIEKLKYTIAKLAR